MFLAHLKTQLEEYAENYPKIKIVRAKKREGLIRARLMGARYASAPVLTYLDSHCECTEGKPTPDMHVFSFNLYRFSRDEQHPDHGYLRILKTAV